jgi:hypothetical protein
MEVLLRGVVERFLLVREGDLPREEVVRLRFHLNLRAQR